MELIFTPAFFFFFFFFNDTATTEIYTLSLHDALPICPAADRTDAAPVLHGIVRHPREARGGSGAAAQGAQSRSEEHTSELQSRLHLVCRLLLEKKKKKNFTRCGRYAYTTRFILVVRHT